MDDNRVHWNDLAELHPETEYYDVEGFRDGETSLDWLEREGVGSVDGQTCYTSSVTSAWTRCRGCVKVHGRAVGVDFSATAIETARALASEVGLADRTTFVESSVYELPDVLDEQFDVVFTSYGVLNWLPDIEAWADVVSTFLKPDGRFFIAELHPMSHVFMDLTVDDDGTIRSDWPYFSDDPLDVRRGGTYADFEAEVDHTVTHEWSHSLGEIVTALVDAGVAIDELREHPFASFEQFPRQDARATGRSLGNPRRGLSVDLLPHGAQAVEVILTRGL